MKRTKRLANGSPQKLKKNITLREARGRRRRPDPVGVDAGAEESREKSKASGAKQAPEARGERIVSRTQAAMVYNRTRSQNGIPA